MPGIFAQTIVFAAATTAIGMCDDINKGIIDRFRSLPMARSAVLTGRTSSDVVYNAGILVVLMVSGLVVGWTVHTGFVALIEGVALLLLFAFAMSGSASGSGCRSRRSRSLSRSRSPSSSRSRSSRTSFVPIETMPTWLQPFAEWNPTSTLSSGLRACGETRSRTRRPIAWRRRIRSS